MTSPNSSGDAGWLRHPGKIHVPLFADHLAGVVGLADEADNVLVAVDRRVNGIAAERAEPAGDRMECWGRQILIAHRQHAIMMQRAAQILKAGIVRRGGQVDPAHLGAEGTGDREYLEPLETHIAQHRRHLPETYLHVSHLLNRWNLCQAVLRPQPATIIR